MTTCADITLSLGVYLLGALDPAERAAVDAHLAECPLCRAELAELAALPSVLSQLSVDDVMIEPVDVPADLFERVASQARAEAAQRAPERPGSAVTRHRRLLAVAAVIVLVLVVSVGSWAAVRHHSPDHYVSAAGPVHMSVSLASQATGTGYTVTVAGLPVDEHCQLVAIGKGGTREVIGRWNATYQGTATQTGSTSIPQSELTQLVLLGDGGAQLATVDV